MDELSTYSGRHWRVGGILLGVVAGSVLVFLGGGVLFALVGAVVLLGLVPRTEVLGSCSRTLDGRGGFAESAYAVIFLALCDDHALPAELTPWRVRVGPPVRGVRNTLRVRIGGHHVLVSVFGLGDDLHLGWTLFRRQPPALAALRWIMVGDGLLERDLVRAVVHNAVRQGVEAAESGREVSVAEVLGEEPPDELESVSDTVREVTVVLRTEVFAADGVTSVGHVEPGFSCELLGDDDGGLVLRDVTGALAVLRDRSSVRCL